MNITPFVLWAFGAVVGYLIAGTRAALIGLAIAMGITLLVTLCGGRK